MMNLKRFCMMKPPESISSPIVWERIRSVLKKHNLLPEKIIGYDKNYSNDMAKFFLKYPLSINFKTEHLKIYSSLIGNCDFTKTYIDEKLAINNIWDDIVCSFSDINLLQAYICDIEYEKWQNTEDIRYYIGLDRDISQASLCHNNLPPPLDRMIIDTSRNPGRYCFRQGYLEAVGSTMWLGDEFWKLVGEHRRDALLAADWAEVREVAPGILRIQVAPDPFTDDSTADLQNRLRALLYPDVDK